MNNKNNKRIKDSVVLKYLLGAVGAGITGAILTPTIHKLGDIIASNMIYKVDISDANYQFKDVLSEIVSNYPKIVQTEYCEPEYMTRDPLMIVPSGWKLDKANISVIKHNGTLILLQIDYIGDSNEIRNGSNQYTKLLCLNTKFDKHNLEDFIEVLYKKAYQNSKHDKHQNGAQLMIYSTDRYGARWINHRFRTFDDVFVPNETKDVIKNMIHHFVDNRQWYINNCIPHHMGIMLYGNPGTGKSSIAQAIASSVPGIDKVVVVNGEDIKYISDVVNNTIGQHALTAETYNAIIFEDVDTGLASLNRENNEHHIIKNNNDDDDNIEVCGLGKILNYLDGVSAPTNCLFIFTTNHIDAIDPAITRPGRCDLVLEIKYVDVNTLKQFLEFHFPTDYISIPDSYKIKSNLTFAELQNQVACGATVDDVIEYCKKTNTRTKKSSKIETPNVTNN